MSLTGVQCKNISCIRLPYCHVHAKKLLGLKVMKSTIPHAGCGLFTIKDIKKNNIICEYFGEELTERQFEQRYPLKNSKYIFQKNKNTFIDSLCIRSLAAMSNTKVLKKDCNARFSISRDRKRVNIIATKNIKANMEIFTYYGRFYKI